MPLSIHGTNGITFNDGSTQNTRPAVGFRNRIINGDMRIDQRNAGGSVTPTTNATYVVDRWAAGMTQSSKFSMQQQTSVVPTGFSHAIKVTSLSAYSVATSDFFEIYQPIEGFNFYDMSFGTANAQSVTISFWVYSSLTGTFGGSIINSTGTRSYPFSYLIGTANTWTKLSVTILGDTTGTWVGATNGIGAYIVFGLGSGATYSGTANTWSNGNSQQPTSTVSVVGTNGATFYITGVQLEAGSTATDFERRPYGTELALCQRYYWTGNLPIMRNFTGGTIAVSSSIGLPVTMRTTPSTVTVASGTLETAYSSTISAYSSGITSGQAYTAGTATASAEL